MVKPGFRKGHLTSNDALLFSETQRQILHPLPLGTFNHVTSTALIVDGLRATLRIIHYPLWDLEPGTTFELPAASA